MDLWLPWNAEQCMSSPEGYHRDYFPSGDVKRKNKHHDIIQVSQ